MDPSEEKCKVLIVGAGPVGMLTALLLAQRGIASLLIERRQEASEWSRAIGITPPSLDILSRLGLQDRFLSRGVRVQTAVIHDDRGCAGRVDFGEIESDYRFILALPQSETVSILESAVIESQLIDYRRGLELRDLSCLPDGLCAVMADLEGGGERCIRAEWLLGADGAHSTVRDLLSVSVRRRLYPQRFLMADFEDNTGWGDAAHLFFTRHGSLESFPLPEERRRWVALCREDCGDLEPGEYLRRRTALISGVDLPSSPVSPVFGFQPERADLPALVLGRVVLAGDAAHLMSPIGGQGMNSGMGDAALLAEILPLVAADPGQRDLLSGYDRRRRRAARVAARRAGYGMWAGTRTGRPASALRSAIFRNLLLRGPIHSRLAPHFAMLTIPGNRRVGV